MGYETESINEVEDVLLPEDVASLRAEMYSQISSAVSLGVFTDSEASQWKSGFEACTEISHMENLIDVIDDFVRSGLYVVNKIEDLLDNELISESEKRQWRGTTEDASFDEKEDIIRELRGVVGQVKFLKRSLISVLNKKKIESSQKTTFLKEFISSDMSSKEKIIKNVDKLEVNKTSNSKKVDQEKINEKLRQEQIIKNKNKYKEAITGYLVTNRFKSARNVLETGKQYFEFDEYSLISGNIDNQEITATQKEIRLVA